MRAIPRAAAVLLLVAGCGGTGIQAGGPDAGVATVSFAPRPYTASDATPTALVLELAHVQVLGDAPPPPPPDMPPPRPDMGPPPGGVELDLVSSQGRQLALTDLQQGVYSRVQFGLAELHAEGTVDGTPFRVHLDFGFAMHPVVNLRAAEAQDLGPGMDVAFTVAVDPNGWFAGGVLASCPKDSGGTYEIDRMHCPGALETIAFRLPPSFSLQ